MQKNFKSLTTVKDRLMMLRNKIAMGTLEQGELRKAVVNVLGSMKTLDEQNRASILLGIYDIYSLLSMRKNSPQLLFLQQRMANLIAYFINKAQVLQKSSLSLKIREDNKAEELAGQTTDQAAYYYQLAYNLSNALTDRGIMTIKPAKAPMATLETIKTKARNELKMLQLRLPKEVQESFKTLVPPVKGTLALEDGIMTGTFYKY